MANEEDIRWKQRFDNFEKSLHLLKQSLLIHEPNITEMAGIIKFFEISFELSWKVLKDYMENLGNDNVNFPRQIIKEAYQANLINHGQIWLQALNDRNVAAHTYDEVFAKEMTKLIKETYFPVLLDLYNNFKSKL